MWWKRVSPFKESQWKLRQYHDQKVSNGGKANAKQMLGSEKINKSKRIGLWEQHSEKPVEMLTIRIELFENVAKFTRLNSSTGIG